MRDGPLQLSYQPGGMPGTIDVWQMPAVDAEFGLGAG